jgi:hypothetical protein
MVSLRHCPCLIPEIPASTSASTPASTSASTSASTLASTFASTSTSAPASTFASTLSSTPASIPVFTFALDTVLTSASTLASTSSVPATSPVLSTTSSPVTPFAPGTSSPVSTLTPELLSEKAVNLAVLILYSKEYQIFIHSLLLVCVSTLILIYYLKKRELSLIKSMNIELINGRNSSINNNSLCNNSNTLFPNLREQYTNLFRFDPVSTRTSTPTLVNPPNDTSIAIVAEAPTDSHSIQMVSRDEFHSVQSLEM